MSAFISAVGRIRKVLRTNSNLILNYRSCRKNRSGWRSCLFLKKSRRKCLRSIRKNSGKKSGIFKSDCRNLPHNCRASAIKPTFLWMICNSKSYNKNKKWYTWVESLVYHFGGSWGVRTPDPLLVRQMLWTSWAKLPSFWDCKYRICALLCKINVK